MLQSKNHARRLLAVCLIALSSACTEHSMGPGSLKNVKINLRPTFVLAPGAQIDFRPIHRIRLTARDAATNAVVDAVTENVNPDDATWTVSFDITPTSASQVVFVTVELIHLEGTTEIV